MIDVLLSIVEKYVEWRNAPRSAVVAAWRAAAETCGVTDLRWDRERLGQDSSLRGRWGAHPVRFELSGRRDGVRTLVVVGRPTGVAADISLRLEGEIGRREQGHVSELQVGDPEFDDEVYIQGPGPVLRAVLDVETRWVVLQVLRGHLVERQQDRLSVQAVVVYGELRAEVAGHDKYALAALPEALRLLLKTARHLSPPEDVPARLAHNARHEPQEAVRVANLMTLDRAYPGAPVTRETLRSACNDSSDEVRLHAAVALGAEGRSVLLAIATRENAAEGWAARAVEALGADLPAATAATLLARARRRGQTSLALACIVSLGRGAAPESVKTLGEVLQGRQEPSLSAAAARALGRTKRVEAEGPLLQALRHDSAAVRLAAAGSLADVGSPSAVLPLKELAEREPGAVRSAARAAVAEIQARVTGASPGQVSLSEGDSGRVSLAESEEGRVSLPDTDRGPAGSPDPDRTL